MRGKLKILRGWQDITVAAFIQNYDLIWEARAEASVNILLNDSILDYAKMQTRLKLMASLMNMKESEITNLSAGDLIRVVSASAFLVDIGTVEFRFKPTIKIGSRNYNVIFNIDNISFNDFRTLISYYSSPRYTELNYHNIADLLLNSINRWYLPNETHENKALNILNNMKMDFAFALSHYCVTQIPKVAVNRSTIGTKKIAVEIINSINYN